MDSEILKNKIINCFDNIKSFELMLGDLTLFVELVENKEYYYHISIYYLNSEIYFQEDLYSELKFEIDEHYVYFNNIQFEISKIKFKLSE